MVALLKARHDKPPEEMVKGKKKLKNLGVATNRELALAWPHYRWRPDGVSVPELSVSPTGVRDQLLPRVAVWSAGLSETMCWPVHMDRWRAGWTAGWLDRSNFPLRLFNSTPLFLHVYIVRRYCVHECMFCLSIDLSVCPTACDLWPVIRLISLVSVKSCGRPIACGMSVPATVIARL